MIDASKAAKFVLGYYSGISSFQVVYIDKLDKEFTVRYKNEENSNYTKASFIPGTVSTLDQFPITKEDDDTVRQQKHENENDSVVRVVRYMFSNYPGKFKPIKSIKVDLPWKSQLK